MRRIPPSAITGVGTLAAVLLAVGVAWAGAALAQRVNVPAPPKGRAEACVEPTEVMRRDHMRFILHQRDRTVHQGIRTSRHSFTGCIDCHAVRKQDGQLARFDEPEFFCTECHRYTAVQIDCFECHADRPEQSTATSRRPTPLFRAPSPEPLAGTALEGVHPLRAAAPACNVPPPG